MTRIIVYHPYNYNRINGNFFYNEEISQYFSDNGYTCLILNHSGIDRNSLKERYLFFNDECSELTANDCLVIPYYGVRFALQNVDLLSKILVISSSNISQIFDVLSNSERIEFLRNKKKFALLYQKNFEPDKNIIDKFGACIDIQRGFYFKHYVAKDKFASNKYLLYTSNCNQMNRYFYHHREVEKICREYCNDNKIKYDIIDSKFNTMNPANFYDGLLYVRYKDYMPRLPYEFWFYDKPVIFFDISDGIKNMHLGNIPLLEKINLHDKIKDIKVSVSIDEIL